MMEIHRKGEVDFVGGTRGGFIFPGFQMGADAILTAVKILEMMAKTRTRLGDISKEFDQFNRQIVSIPCPWSKKGKVMRRLITGTDTKQRQLIDGVRIFEDNGWVLIAPDRFKASFNILAESRSKKDTSNLLDRYRTLVEEFRNN
jgi:mannose-1-phosphate guanylyltransferase/phosphomannomutase